MDLELRVLSFMKQEVVIENLVDSSSNYSVTLTKPGLFYYICFGFAEVEKNIDIHIASEGVEAHILGLFIGHEDVLKINTLQHHAAPNSMSSLHIKSVLTGDASFQYRGNIKTDKQAQQSNAYQQNDNLLLSQKAHVDTKPELEIIANDVKCSHGATIGRLNEDELYYIQSRGVSRDEAYQLALQGFVQDVIMKIPDEQARCELNQYAMEALQNLSTKKGE